MNVVCHVCKKNIKMIENKNRFKATDSVFINEKEVLRDETGFICLDCYNIQSMQKEIYWYKKVKGII